MTEIASIAPPNSLFFIADRSGGAVPDFVEDRLVLSTDSGIIIRCLANVDGETQVALGPAADVSSEREPVFDGVIATPTRTLLVSTVEREEVVAAVVPSTKTRLRIWTNRLVEPDDIVFGWGE